MNPNLLDLVCVHNMNFNAIIAIVLSLGERMPPDERVPLLPRDQYIYTVECLHRNLFKILILFKIVLGSKVNFKTPKQKLKVIKD